MDSPLLILRVTDGRRLLPFWADMILIRSFWNPRFRRIRLNFSADRLNFPPGLQGLAAISCSSTGILLAMKAWQAMALLVRVEVSGRDAHAKIEYVSIYIHILYYIILYYIIYYIILYYIISYYIISYYIILYYIILFHIISFYIILYHIISYYIILYYIYVGIHIHLLIL